MYSANFDGCYNRTTVRPRSSHSCSTRCLSSPKLLSQATAKSQLLRRSSYDLSCVVWEGLSKGGLSHNLQSALGALRSGFLSPPSTPFFSAGIPYLIPRRLRFCTNGFLRSRLGRRISIRDGLIFPAVSCCLTTRSAETRIGAGPSALGHRRWGKDSQLVTQSTALGHRIRALGHQANFYEFR
eukprot:COSAG02_NODE_217_length_28595_cov_19.642371_35_plen_183_part_00